MTRLTWVTALSILLTTASPSVASPIYLILPAIEFTDGFQIQWNFKAKNPFQPGELPGLDQNVLAGETAAEALNNTRDGLSNQGFGLTYTFDRSFVDVSFPILGSIRFEILKITPKFGVQNFTSATATIAAAGPVPGHGVGVVTDAAGESFLAVDADASTDAVADWGSSFSTPPLPSKPSVFWTTSPPRQPVLS